MKAILRKRLIVILAAGLVWAQPHGKGQEPPEPKTDALSARDGDCAWQDADRSKACNQWQLEVYSYNISALRQRSDTFRWNLVASEIMFAVVVLLVLSGLVFAALQFRLAFHQGTLVAQGAQGKDKSADASDRAGTGLATDMELSEKGIKVSSSVLGVVVLLISMAFFYLYAQYVYPIQAIRPDTTERGAAK